MKVRATNSFAQRFHTLEFRHEPKAAVSPQTRVAYFVFQTRYAEERERPEENNGLGGATTGFKVDLLVRGDP